MMEIWLERVVKRQFVSLLFFVTPSNCTTLLDSLIEQPYFTALLDSLIGQPYWTALHNADFSRNQNARYAGNFGGALLKLISHIECRTCNRKASFNLLLKLTSNYL